METNYRYLFGPVPSRRFQRSLGVDLIPFKTCSFDCVFCQLGKTLEKTVARKDYVPVDAVIEELDHWLKTDGQADFITLSGSGEPTLHRNFGEILRHVREHTSLSSVLLTNSTLFDRSEVREAACQADIVKVSLSAWDQASFEWVNRPHPRLRFDQLIQGQKDFRAQYKAQLWMEVFLVDGINSMPADVRKIAAIARQIKPDRIQLNTVVRPPAEAFAAPVSSDRMNELSQLFDPPAEVIAGQPPGWSSPLQVNQDRILSMLQRRPCTSNDIADAFGMHLNEVAKYLGNLMRKDLVRAERKNSTIYYIAAEMRES